MKKTYRFLTLFILLACGISTGIGTERPRLVVGIVVDQLQTDYLDYLSPMMTDGGFNRLIQQGVYITDLDFPHPVTDAVASAAELYTGAWPSTTGVVAEREFDRRTHRLVPTLLGPQGYSPEKLLLSTVTDEIVIDGQRFGQVYALAADPQLAVILGGHTPTSSIWIDPLSGQWTTSPYYGTTLPAPLVSRNLRSPLRARIDTMRWQPLLDIKNYPGLPAHKKYYPFGHIFRSSDRDAYTLFGRSPLGNREVTDAALAILNDLKPANGNIDMLNIGYSLAPYTATRDGDYRLELTDSYLQLDRDLTRLLNAIYSKTDKEDVMIYILSTGHFDNDGRPADKYRIPGGELSTRRAAALLNSYLGARYGHADYVEGIAGTHVYFNSKAMDEALRKAAGTLTPLQDARDFLSRMDGIAAVTTISDILGGTTEALEQARRALDSRTAGDLIIEVQPGWTLVDDFSIPSTSKAIRRSTFASPAIIAAPTLMPGKISTPVAAISIAPTLCRLLRIQMPNGASAHSIPLQHNSQPTNR